MVVVDEARVGREMDLVLGTGVAVTADGDRGSVVERGQVAVGSSDPEGLA